MNWKAWLVLFGFLAMKDSAFAYRPIAEEKPYLRAELVELDESGHEIQGIVANPVLTMNARNSVASSFTLVEFNGQSTFVLLRSYQTPCRTTVYEAREAVENGRRLTLEDHEGRVCMDYRKYQWEAVLSSQEKVKKTKKRVTRFKRALFGNPKPVDERVSEDCQKIADDTMCPMIYLPAVCAAVTVDGGKTKLNPPLRAESGNACGATSQLKVQACKQGISPERFLDADISCTLLGIDPL